MRLDSLALEHVRRSRAAVGFLLFAVAAIGGAFAHPAVALLATGVAALLVASDWRVESATLLAMFAGLVLLVPGDIRLAIPLPAEPTADRIALVALFGAWAFGELRSGDIPFALRAEHDVVRRASWPLIGLLFVGIASLMLNRTRTLEAGHFEADAKGLLVLVGYVGVYFLTLALVRDRRGVERVVRALVVTGAAAATVAIVERVTLFNAVRTLLLSIPIIEPSRQELTLVRGAGVRVIGTGEHAIAFGGAMALILPLAVYLALSARKARWVGAWAAMTALIGGAMMFTVSRSALIAAAVSAVVLLLLWPQKRQLLATAGVVALFATHMFVPGLLGTFRATLNPSYILTQEQNENTYSTRMGDYPRVAAIVPRQPLFGLGYNDFDPTRNFHLDNQFLKLLLEVGVAGTLLAALFVGRSAAAGIRGARARPDTAVPIEAAFAGGIVGFAVQSLLFDTLGFTQTAYVFLIIAALAARSAALALAPAETPRRGS